jgi:Tol biopolymer transport system component
MIEYLSIIIIFIFTLVGNCKGETMSKTDLRKELLKIEKIENWRLLSRFSASEDFYLSTLEDSLSKKYENVREIKLKDASIHSPSLSADTRKVAFFGFPDSKNNSFRKGLYTINSDNSKLELITEGFQIGSSEDSICWSPDGKKIAFIAIPKGRYTKEELNALYIKFKHLIPQSLYTIDIETKKVETLVEDDVWILYSQAWSNDSKEIVYVNTNKEIMIYNLDTKSSRKLADGNNPSWSRDGKWIIFSGWPSTEGRYHIVHPDGSDKQLLLAYKRKKGEVPLIKTSALISSYPLWSPNGRYILLSSTSVTLTMREYRILYIVDFETKKIIKLGEGTVFTSWEGKP